jgi:hypothetical protein
LAIFDEFKPIKTPKPGDNLYENAESGQTYSAFTSASRNHVDKERSVIYLATFQCYISEKALIGIQ